jgi:hypothetical protein
MLKYAAFGAVVMLIGAAGAGAGSLINGNRIKKGTISENRLRTSVIKKINSRSATNGPVGAQGGQQGAQGGQGQKGDNGTASYAGPHWGLIDRNTIGSPVGALRSGPFEGTGAGSSPPFGIGSLGFSVKDGTEKVAFGNEVDFAGNALSGLSQAGFRVFQTGENASSPGNAQNLPNIDVEVFTTGTSGYSTLVWVPDGSSTATVPLNKWSPYIDATTNGQWYYTGGPGTSSGCNQTTMCSFADAKSKFPAAKILTVAVTKGRDKFWNGAIDGLRINNEVFDFEPFGVTTNSP